MDGINHDGSTNGTNSVDDANGAAHRHIDLLDILALNARSEIALGHWDDGCTALAWDLVHLSSSHEGLPLESGRQKRILAQNWDWRTTVGPNLALASVKQPDKPDIWMVMEVSCARPGNLKPKC